MQSTQSLQTVVTLANAAELGAGIAQEVLGNDVSDMVEGNVLTTDTVRSVVLTQIQSQLAIYRGSI